MSVAVRTAAVVLAVMVWMGTAARAQSAAESGSATTAEGQAEKAEQVATAEEPGVVPAPMCATGPVVVAEGKKAARVPSFVEDSFSELKSEAPLLRGLKFEADPGAEPGKSDRILTQTGETIMTMLPRVPNLIAREELAQALVALPYMVSETSAQNAGAGGARRNAAQLYDSSSRGVEGEELQKVLDGMLAAQAKRPVFSYRIQSVPDKTYGRVLNEYRTNEQNESVDVGKLSPGNPRGVGFGGSWLLFTPTNVKEARFRYLGHEKVGKRDTVVLAFAQIPGEVGVPAQITVPSGACSYLVQGVVWIDESAYQIVRLETDLLTPLPGIDTQSVRSVVTFNEVRIPERDLLLWMPSDVEIRWVMKDQAGVERHKYSNYRLFGATSRIVLPTD